MSHLSAGRARDHPVMEIVPNKALSLSLSLSLSLEGLRLGFQGPEGTFLASMKKTNLWSLEGVLSPLSR